MITQEVERKKCNSCKMNMTLEKFTKKQDDSYMKRCIECKNKCEHKRERSKCKDHGGASICEHKRERSKCKDCGGASICEHKRERSKCKDCDFPSYLSGIVRSRIKHSLKSEKELSSKEYLGCNIDEFKNYMEKTFEEGMNWDNYGEWHIDHIIPIKYKEDGKVADLEEVIKRLHYTNTQALWDSER